MLFEIGEKVSLLKESGVYIIVEIQTNVAIVLDEFSLIYTSNILLKQIPC